MTFPSPGYGKGQDKQMRVASASRNPVEKGGVLAVIGSRGFPAAASTVPYAMEQQPRPERVVSGGARGVDSIAEAYAEKMGVVVVSYRPRRNGSHYEVDKWVNGTNLGPVHDDVELFTFSDFRTAALNRNWWIVNDSTRVLALWDGYSTGTAHGIAAAARAHRELRIWMDGDS